MAPQALPLATSLSIHDIKIVKLYFMNVINEDWISTEHKYNMLDHDRVYNTYHISR